MGYIIEFLFAFTVLLVLGFTFVIYLQKSSINKRPKSKQAALDIYNSVWFTACKNMVHQLLSSGFVTVTFVLFCYFIKVFLSPMVLLFLNTIPDIQSTSTPFPFVYLHSNFIIGIGLTLFILGVISIYGYVVFKFPPFFNDTDGGI